MSNECLNVNYPVNVLQMLYRYQIFLNQNSFTSLEFSFVFITKLSFS